MLQLPTATKLFLCNGKVTDKELDMFEAIKRRMEATNRLPKDQLVFSRQRCVIINHGDTLKPLKDRKEETERKQAEEIIKKESKKQKSIENKELKLFKEAERIFRQAEKLGAAEKDQATQTSKKRKPASRFDEYDMSTNQYIVIS